MFKLLLFVWVANGGVAIHEVGTHEGVKECQKAGSTITATLKTDTSSWGYFCVPTR
jgi:hypothetical protein